MYVLIAIILTVVSALLFRRAAGSLSLRYLNMSTYVFYLLLATAVIGSTMTAEGWIEIPMLYGLYDPSVVVFAWVTVMYSMLAIPCGMLLANAWWGGDRPVPVQIAEYRDRKMEPVLTWGDGAMRASLAVGLILAAVALAYTWQHLADVPLLNVLKGERDPASLAFQRASSRLGISERPFFVSFLEAFIWFLQVIAVSAYCYWRGFRRRSDLLLFACSMALTVVSLTWNISKTPFLMFLSGMMVAIVVTRGSISRWAIGIIGGLGVGIATAMYIFYRAALGEGDIAVASVMYKMLTGRLGTGQLLIYYIALDSYPRVIPHLWFASTGRFIHEVLGLPFSPDYGISLMALIDPEGVQAGVAGHATSIFLAEAWANFSWIGIIIFPFVIGLLVHGCHIWFLRARKTPLHVGVYAYLTFTFTLASGVQMFYYPAWLVQLLAMVAFFIGLALVFRLLRPSPRVVAPHAGPSPVSG